jgi:hypothetical protein
MAPTPDQDTRFHLQLLDEGLEALASGLARLLTDAKSARTPLDPSTNAGLSVPAGERPVPVTHDAAST